MPADYVTCHRASEIAESIAQRRGAVALDKEAVTRAINDVVSILIQTSILKTAGALHPAAAGVFFDRAASLFNTLGIPHPDALALFRAAVEDFRRPIK